jgi:hypothetical protein
MTQGHMQTRQRVKKCTLKLVQYVKIWEKEFSGRVPLLEQARVYRNNTVMYLMSLSTNYQSKQIRHSVLFGQQRASLTVG